MRDGNDKNNGGKHKKMKMYLEIYTTTIMYTVSSKTEYSGMMQLGDQGWLIDLLWVTWLIAPDGPAQIERRSLYEDICVRIICLSNMS